MTLILLALGFLPLGAGLLFERFILAYPPDQVPPFFLIGLLFLLLWGLLAFFAAGREGHGLRAAILLNIPALLFLVLNGVQILLLGAYWSNVLGHWSQLFFLPVLNLGSRLAFWLPSSFAHLIAAFVLMAGASLVGCRVRKKLSEGGLPS